MSRRRRNIFAPRESLIQQACVDHWRMLRVPGSLVAAIPNARAFGQPGLTKGLPDLLVIAPALPVGFIELKRDEDSVVSDAQRDFAMACHTLGIPYERTVGRDEPIRVLEEWGAVRRATRSQVVTARNRAWRDALTPAQLEALEIAKAGRRA
jgi:hypothetical protein